MRRVREVLRLKHELRRSHREIAGSLGIANSTVSDYVGRARAAGLSWPLPEGLDDAALEAALFPAPAPSRVRRPEPDWARVHRERQRHKGVTLQLLWLEYRAAHPDVLQYSRFCERYREWRGTLGVAMRQAYRAGEKAFVDYARPTCEVVDRKTGEVRDAMVFAGVLGVSSHTFVDVTWSRSLPDRTRCTAPPKHVVSWKGLRVASGANPRLKRASGMPTKRTNSGATTGYEAELWAMADTLRGSIRAMAAIERDNRALKEVLPKDVLGRVYLDLRPGVELHHVAVR